jgi:hypothetical protein
VYQSELVAPIANRGGRKASYVRSCKFVDVRSSTVQTSSQATASSSSGLVCRRYVRLVGGGGEPSSRVAAAGVQGSVPGAYGAWMGVEDEMGGIEWAEGVSSLRS